MKILLDTHAFLWMITGAEDLSKTARKIVLNSENTLFLSMASVWEMAIKSSLGKLTLRQPLKQFIPEQLQMSGISLLNIAFQHIAKVALLPLHHRDPFDRLLIAQSLVDKINILSSDKVFDAYKLKRLW